MGQVRRKAQVEAKAFADRFFQWQVQDGIGLGGLRVMIVGKYIDPDIWMIGETELRRLEITESQFRLERLKSLLELVTAEFKAIGPVSVQAVIVIPEAKAPVPFMSISRFDGPHQRHIRLAVLLV